MKGDIYITNCWCSDCFRKLRFKEEKQIPFKVTGIMFCSCGRRGTKATIDIKHRDKYYQKVTR